MTYNYFLTPNHNMIRASHPEYTLTACWNDAEAWGELVAITDYGNYAYRWDTAVGRFGDILRSPHDHLMDRLLAGHAEQSTIKPEETRALIAARYVLEDELIEGLKRCKTEAEFAAWARQDDVVIDDVWSSFVYGYGHNVDEFIAYIIPKIWELGEKVTAVSEVQGGRHEQ